MQTGSMQLTCRLRCIYIIRKYSVWREWTLTSKIVNHIWIHVRIWSKDLHSSLRVQRTPKRSFNCTWYKVVARHFILTYQDAVQISSEFTSWKQYHIFLSCLCLVQFSKFWKPGVNVALKRLIKIISKVKFWMSLSQWELFSGAASCTVYSESNEFLFSLLQMPNSQMRLQQQKRFPLNSRTGAWVRARTSQDPPRSKTSRTSSRKSRRRSCGSTEARSYPQQRTVMTGTPWRKSSSKQCSS